jgi:hypothetical protein
MKMSISISILIMIFMTGCLTPYSNEFICKPSIVGHCTKSVVEQYKNTLNEIEQKEKHHENNSFN